MMSAGLSFEQSPPLSVPLRFYLTAPLFLLLAAMLLIWQGAEIFTSRWLPITLAFTHLFTLGFMAEIMAGSVLQILPVVVGVSAPHPRLIAAILHPALTLGTLALVIGFLAGISWCFHLAATLLGLSLGLLLVILIRALWRAPAVGETVVALRWAALALLMTVVPGLILAGYFGWGLNVPVLEVTHLHAVWGIVGWTLFLLMAVAFQVVPMFQITPPYPVWLTQWLVSILGATLLLWSILTMGWLGTPTWLDKMVSTLLAVGLLLFAVATLRLLAQRRRKAGDATLNFWRLSMTALLLGTVMSIAMLWTPTLSYSPVAELFLGVVILFGFAGAVINGMLYKIVPFLVWFHLQALLFRRAKVPNMKKILPDSQIRQQFLLYFLATLLLLAATLKPAWFVYPAALALALVGLGIFYDLFCAWRIYQKQVVVAENLPTESISPVYRDRGEES